jgi:hypothetical protein
MFLDGLTGQPLRIRDGRVLDEHVKAAKLVSDTLRRRFDRSRIRHVELERERTQPNFSGRSLAAFETARPHQHGQAAGREIICDLMANSLISPGY